MKRNYTVDLYESNGRLRTWHAETYDHALSVAMASLVDRAEARLGAVGVVRDVTGQMVWAGDTLGRVWSLDDDTPIVVVALTA